MRAQRSEFWDTRTSTLGTCGLIQGRQMRTAFGATNTRVVSGGYLYENRCRLERYFNTQPPDTLSSLLLQAFVELTRSSSASHSPSSLRDKLFFLMAAGLIALP